MEKATVQQVRDYYRADGYEVRISEDGHVKFRNPREAAPIWLEGRWVSEYRVDDGKVVLI
jgi:hypothetical protein